MTSAPTSLPFDARPLTEPVDRAAARAYVRELRRSGRAPAPNVVGIVIAIVFGAVALFMFGSVFAGIAGTIAVVGRGQGGVFAIAPLVLLAAFLAIVVSLIVRVVRGGNAERWYRLDRFAQANGMRWYPEVSAPPLPGMIFGVGHGRRATDVVRGEQPRLVEFGNYTYKTGSGKNESTHRWGYVAVKLSTPLPHIVLDALGNNGLFGSNLPAAFDRDQRLSLEGDFDRYFTLSCPTGYERDALYLFTPDIMARFVDNAAALDVEIIDDWLFLYTGRETSTLDPATWAWLFAVVRALLEKLDQWERWRDDRLATTSGAAVGASAPGASGASVSPSAGLPFAAPTAMLQPPPGVAPAGRRLRRGVPWGFIAIAGTAFLIFVLTQTGVLAGIVGSILR